MTYRLTPFHFVILLLVIQAVYSFILNANAKTDPGLAGLIPFLQLGIAFGLLIFDLVLQFLSSIIFRNRILILYISELIFSILAIIWYSRIGGFH